MNTMSRAALAMHRRRKGVRRTYFAQEGTTFSADGPHVVKPLAPPPTMNSILDDFAERLRTPPKRRLSDAERIARTLSDLVKRTLVEEFCPTHLVWAPDDYLVGFGIREQGGHDPLGTLMRRQLIMPGSAFTSGRRWFLTPLGAEVRRAVIGADAS